MFEVLETNTHVLGLMWLTINLVRDIDGVMVAVDGSAGVVV